MHNLEKLYSALDNQEILVYNIQNTENLDLLCAIMKVYEKIRVFLGENGMDIEEISKKADIPYDDFIAILNGDKVLHADEFRAICIAINVKPEKFI